MEQLKEGGRLILPVGEKHSSQVLTIVDKDLEGNISIKKPFAVRYVPLTSLKEQSGFPSDL